MADPQIPTVDGLPSPAELRRLGKNINGYCGETIELEAVLSDCLTAAEEHGWVVEEVRAGEVRLHFLMRGVGQTRLKPAQRNSPHLEPQTNPPHPNPSPKGEGDQTFGMPDVKRVYLSTGIHGDEPAGPLAVRRLLQENRWPEDLGLWLCPCLNPSGFPLNRRENAAGLDLNREYLQPRAPETLAHIAWLERQPSFDLTLCLHEDWEGHGFYVYELNPNGAPSLAPAMIQRVRQVCPIDPSGMIEGREAAGGIIRPSIDPRSRPQWPEAFYLLTHKTRLSYTLEAPSDFPLTCRVEALVAAVSAALALVR